MDYYNPTPPDVATALANMRLQYETARKYEVGASELAPVLKRCINELPRALREDPALRAEAQRLKALWPNPLT